jgi:hypothetical protein
VEVELYVNPESTWKRVLANPLQRGIPANSDGKQIDYVPICIQFNRQRIQINTKQIVIEDIDYIEKAVMLFDLHKLQK